MMGFGHMGIMGGFSLIFWILIIIGIIYFFSTRNNSGTNYNSNYHSRENRAVEVAKERYARGEISKAELDELLKDLRY